MTENTSSDKSFPQTTDLQKWVAAECEKGLIDVKFFAPRNIDATVESFAGEVNQLLKAQVVPDPDLN